MLHSFAAMLTYQNNLLYFLNADKYIVVYWHSPFLYPQGAKSQYSVQKWRIKHNILFIFHLSYNLISFSDSILLKNGNPQISSRRSSANAKETRSFSYIQSSASHSIKCTRILSITIPYSRERKTLNIIYGMEANGERCIKSLSSQTNATLHMDY